MGGGSLTHVCDFAHATDMTPQEIRQALQDGEDPKSLHDRVSEQSKKAFFYSTGIGAIMSYTGFPKIIHEMFPTQERILLPPFPMPDREAKFLAIILLNNGSKTAGFWKRIINNVEKLARCIQRGSCRGSCN